MIHSHALSSLIFSSCFLLFSYAWFYFISHIVMYHLLLLICDHHQTLRCFLGRDHLIHFIESVGQQPAINAFS